MNDDIERIWVSKGIQPAWSGDGWSLHRRNRTSGKSRGGIIARGMSEYTAKTTANDGNLSPGCFTYTPVSPTGEFFKLEPPLERTP